MIAKVLNTIANKSKLLVVVMLIALTAIAGCQKSAETPEPPANAMSSYNCDVMQGFKPADSSPEDSDSKKEQIQNLENEIKGLQAKIASRQNDLKALQSGEKSEEIKNIENEIKSLQAKITSLQNDLKALQSAEKSDEIKNLENEIKSLQTTLASRQNELRALERDSSKSGEWDDKHTQVGHIEYLKIGDTVLDADLSVVNPISANQSDVVGILSSIYWEGGYADPILFSCQVSEASKTKIAAMEPKSLSNTEVELMFSVYAFDPQAKAYYKSFHSDSVKLKGLVSKSGGKIYMDIATEQSFEVPSPQNYSFNLGVMPQGTSQSIHIAVSITDKIEKKWGVAVGAK